MRRLLKGKGKIRQQLIVSIQICCRPSNCFLIQFLSNYSNTYTINLNGSAMLLFRPYALFPITLLQDLHGGMQNGRICLCAPALLSVFFLSAGPLCLIQLDWPYPDSGSVAYGQHFVPFKTDTATPERTQSGLPQALPLQAEGSAFQTHCCPPTQAALLRSERSVPLVASCTAAFHRQRSRICKAVVPDSEGILCPTPQATAASI